ncbi:MAG: AraC family transcriptional regulator [Clostridium sp.]|nr:AraC family transcriptional regulator [Clostridium sp.]MCM1443736.1 AraC family transcriptional regulator [Candidatus Amulumruptor caecigallinarius]
MNIYKSLNNITKYIEDNLEQQINYEVLAKFLGVNVYTMQRLFTMLTNISLSEYIRKRRLSNAGFDLYNSNIKIIDLALKYQYDNATSFSRAFLKFHGIKPSLVNKSTKLKNFPRIVFNENINITTELDYEIIELNEFNLYGVSIKTNNDNIDNDAPYFFQETQKKYISILGNIKYGMTTYDSEREECQKYYCLYDKKIKEFESIKIPASKWLKFRICSHNAKDIQEKVHKFYKQFLPSCKYNLKEIPELEYYHDDITDFLVAIY